MAILFFLTSRARAIFLGNFLQHDSKKNLSFIAAVPNMILSVPTSINFETLFSFLIPPPTSTLILNFLINFSIISILTKSPLSAPSRSIICKFLNPSSLKIAAWWIGFSL